MFTPDSAPHFPPCRPQPEPRDRGSHTSPLVTRPRISFHAQHPRFWAKTAGMSGGSHRSPLRGRRPQRRLLTGLSNMETRAYMHVHTCAEGETQRAPEPGSRLHPVHTVEGTF